jgi:acetyl esterase/lipase
MATTTTPSKYANFDQKDFVYKKVNNTPISTTVLIPKTLTTASTAGTPQPDKPQNKKKHHPILVHLHGGFLICGSKLYQEWHSTWTIQLALLNAAIIVTPNYRLLPEANGTDVLCDLCDFWSWVQECLATAVASMTTTTTTETIQIDMNSILVCGESAGGYLAIQSALLLPNMRFKAILSQYGMLDHKLAHFTQKSTTKYLAGAPQQPESEIENYLLDMQKGAVRTETHPWEMWLFICATVQAGRYLEFLGDGENVHVIENLEKIKGAKLPACWIIHGKEDSLVSC